MLLQPYVLEELDCYECIGGVDITYMLHLPISKLCVAEKLPDMAY